LITSTNSGSWESVKTEVSAFSHVFFDLVLIHRAWREEEKKPREIFNISAESPDWSE
jgi:hypothetical protein